ncbi:MAG: hypothetical protein ACI4JZ_07265 [Oscillospiraceae bacterium]
MYIFQKCKTNARSLLREFGQEDGNAKVIAVTVISCVLVVLLVLIIIFREPIGAFLSDFADKYLNFGNLEASG